MEKAGFLLNLNDFMMALTVSMCLFSAVITASLPDKNKLSKYFLVALFCFLAFGPLHKLVFYGEFIRPWALEHNVNLFSYFIIGRWLVLPLLYFYIRFYISSSNRINPVLFFHFLPTLFIIAFLYLYFYQFDNDRKVQLIESYELFFSNGYATLIGFLCVATVFYIILSSLHILKHKEFLRDNLSNPRQANMKWLGLLMITLFLEGLLLFIGYFGGRGFQGINLGPYVGTFSIYVNLCFVLILVYTRLRYLPILQELPLNYDLADTDTRGGYIENELVSKLDIFIKENKPHLNPDLSLKELAAAIELHPRKLSELINKSYKMNFFEFVNSHRINEAKHLLKFDKRKRITDIYLASGFSTRTAFNKAFLKFVKMTPTDFRRRISTKE